MFFRTKQSGPREYLEIAENRREGGKVKQEVVGRLGRLDVVKQRATLDNLLRSGIRYAQELALLDARKKARRQRGRAQEKETLVVPVILKEGKREERAFDLILPATLAQALTIGKGDTVAWIIQKRRRPHP
jgi:hypothetical protein